MKRAFVEKRMPAVLSGSGYVEGCMRNFSRMDVSLLFVATNSWELPVGAWEPWDATGFMTKADRRESGKPASRMGLEGHIDCVPHHIMYRYTTVATLSCKASSDYITERANRSTGQEPGRCTSMIPSQRVQTLKT